MDALVAAARILLRELTDQRHNLGVDWRSAGALGVGPLLGDQAAMPAQDLRRRDESTAQYVAGKVSAQQAEQGSVGPVQTWFRVGSP